MTDTLPRPRQVTMAAWIAVGASVLVVLTVFDTVAGLHTLETRRTIEQFLAEPPGVDLGLDVDGAIAVVRVLAMVAAGCATAAAVLGFHVLKRSKGARLALTIVAVPLFFAGMVVGGFLSSLVAASALVLWLEPSRDWFNGVRARTAPVPEPGPSAPEQREAPSAYPSPHTPPPPVGSGVVSPGPRAHEGFGTPQHHPVDRSTAAVPAPAPWPPLVPREQERRPGAVVAACVLTWTLAALVAGLMVLTAAVVAAAPDLLFNELDKQNPDWQAQGVSRTGVEVATYVIAGLTCLWAATAAVLGVLVWRRVGWARTALLASAATAGLVCLVAAIGSFVLVVPAVGCLLTASLLIRTEVRAWFARPRGPMHP
jgi:hypothetical protein